MTESGMVSFSSKSAWPESLELKLLAYVQTLNCHIPVDEKKVEKWNQWQKLSADPGFIGRTSSAKNLQVKYKRILDRISTKYGLNGKESLALDLLKQTYDADEANKERKASQEKKQMTMLATKVLFFDEDLHQKEESRRQNLFIKILKMLWWVLNHRLIQQPIQFQTAHGALHPQRNQILSTSIGRKRILGLSSPKRRPHLLACPKRLPLMSVV
jgi:hypothetical protein